MEEISEKVRPDLIIMTTVATDLGKIGMAGGGKNILMEE